MMTRPFLCLALAVAFVSTSATAADVRSSSPSFNIGSRGVTSIGSAAAATPLSAASGQQADSLRSSADREAKHDAMLQKLLKDRRASMGPAAQAANAAIALPHIQGLPVSGNGGAFGFKGLSNFDPAGRRERFHFRGRQRCLCGLQ
jgi:hypothetical protein